MAVYMQADRGRRVGKQRGGCARRNRDIKTQRKRERIKEILITSRDVEKDKVRYRNIKEVRQRAREEERLVGRLARDGSHHQSWLSTYHLRQSGSQLQQ